MDPHWFLIFFVTMIKGKIWSACHTCEGGIREITKV